MPRIALLAVLVASTAWAQTTAFGRSWPTDGLALPPQSAATASEATAPAYNPAALGLVEGTQLFYFHQEGLDFSRGGEGAYLGLGLGGLAAGVSLEWLHGGELARRRRTAWTLAGGGGQLSVGITYNVWSSRDRDVDALDSLDLGMAARPSEWLALAAVVRDVGEPRFAPAREGHVPRRYQLGLGLRPLGDWLTVSVDALGDTKLMSQGLEMLYTAEVRPLPGVRLLLGLAHPVGHGLVGPLPEGAARGPRVQLGLALDGRNFGATYTQAADPGAPTGRISLTTGLRVSSAAYPSIAQPRRRVYAFDVSKSLGAGEELDLESLLGLGGGLDPYTRLILDLHRAARDPLAAGMVLRMGHSALSMARAEELRGAMHAAQSRGKKVVVYLEAADDALYYAAAAADQVWAAPQGEFVVNGLAAEYSFFGETLDKIGARVEYVRVGEFKSYPEAFTRTGMSEAQSEVTRALLDDLDQRYLDALADGRGLDERAARHALDQGIQSANRLVELKLADRLVYPDQIQDALSDVMGQGYTLAGREPTPRPPRWGTRPRIALIRVEGTIAPGPSRGSPLLGSTSGADTITAAIRAAADDAAIEAIVIRVDSGGGDGLASDLIWREVFRARSKKPVIASMGSAAASGGYYVAAGADTIVAEPSTVTGSIGIFALKLDLAGLYEKLGVHVETVTRGERADLFSTSRGLTDAERETMQRWVEELYGVFVDRVAESRKLDKAAVDAVGRGRVWTGRQARERKLVDRLGGLYDAIALARERAGYGSDVEVEVASYGREGGEWPGTAFVQAPAAAVPPAVAEVLKRAGTELLAAGPGALAMMPYVIDVR